METPSAERRTEEDRGRGGREARRERGRGSWLVGQTAQMYAGEGEIECFRPTRRSDEPLGRLGGTRKKDRWSEKRDED